MKEIKKPKVVALAGVPNVGKTTLFNGLTGLKQKIGNYPGVTVDQKRGWVKRNSETVQLIDLPGTYNIYPRSEDEQVVFRVLSGIDQNFQVDAILAVADMANLERGLFLVTQLIDLGYPVALVLNMEDEAERSGQKINKTILSRLLGIPIYTSSADKGVGIDAIKRAIFEGGFSEGRQTIDAKDICDSAMLIKVAGVAHQKNLFRALQVLKFRNKVKDLNHVARLNELANEYQFNDLSAQRDETRLRYNHVHELLAKSVKAEKSGVPNATRKLDRILLHRYWGFAIFFAIMILMFQSIFTWAQAPMEWIDMGFAELANFVKHQLPSGVLTELIYEGIIPGIGGIVIFVPQIALLFAFLAILEGSGYMARAVFICDRVMRPFGLNGRSVVPLISGFACAIPAIMATRTISNRKDRMITIFVTPFMSCSARLPVYIILVGLIFPADPSALIDFRGLALFFLYFIGVVAALASAFVMKLMMKKEASGHLVLELPRYQWPQMRTVLYMVYEKSKTFIFEAGKVILAISVILWVLASYGPGDSIENAQASVAISDSPNEEELAEYEAKLSNAALEASYAGVIGKWMEPAIKPLGYDWKIGIALVCSFAAREVFVSTIATLYSIGDDGEDIQTLQELLKSEKNDKGEPMFNMAVVWSLLIFYAFAMQCMSTVAVVYRETKSIKWPLVQTVFMTVFAYVSAFIVYQLLA
jgi:ferrous iron transport protein B